MQTLLHQLEEKASQAIAKIYGGLLTEEDLLSQVVPCTQENFGHYQCNSPLKLGKLLKKNPREVAIAIAERLSTTDDCFEKVEVAGPGFINLTLKSHFLSQELQKALEDPYLGVHRPKKKERIIVEFSSPNIAKELHVGHLRSTIIGDAIARIFEFLDQEVIRLNHIGDWGTQFGMLIHYLEVFEKEVLLGKKTANLSMLMHWYKESKKQFDADETFKKQAQLKVVELQKKEPQVYQAWKIICDISRKAFEEIYEILGVKLEERGESFYNPYLSEMIMLLKKKGCLSVSDGAKCVFLDGYKTREGEPLPLIVQKSDGAYNYATTDLAALQYRIDIDQANRIIVVVDNGQRLHFQMMAEAAKKAGFLSSNVNFTHVGFGLVLGPDGKKFKTRSGETEKLIDLLTKAVDKAREILDERLEGMSKTDLDHMARILGIDAVKYADLSVHRQKDYSFSYERMLKFEGNTAAFLLYSYVRIQGIKRKIQIDMDQVLKTTKIQLKHPSEVQLGLHLRRFGEVIETVTQDLLPHRIADYLYELAEKFNAFFRDCRVEGTPEQNQRLVLLELTEKILHQGLSILGLKTLDRM